MVEPDAPANLLTFGILVPYFNSAVEPELARLRPEGVQHQTARFALSAAVLDDLADIAGKLLGCGPDAFLLAIAPDNFPNGLALARQASDRIAAATGRAVFSASFAMGAALRALGVETVSVVTPFDDANNRHVVASLEGQGFRVSAAVGLARPSLDQISNTPPAEILAAFSRADTPDSEALVQVGTGLPMAPLLEELECRFAKPVVGANAALYWQALRASSRFDAIPRMGRLLRLAS